MGLLSMASATKLTKHLLWYIVFILLVARHAIVADKRVRQHQDLCTVRWVGEGLWIAHHASLEH